MTATASLGSQQLIFSGTASHKGRQVSVSPQNSMLAHLYYGRILLNSEVSRVRRAGTRISYDLNFRDSLWRSVGGKAWAQEINRSLMPFVDVLFGNEEDFSAALGFELEGVDPQFKDLPTAPFRAMIQKVVAAFPNVATVAATLRTARSASANGWGAICYHGGQFHEVAQRDVEILDRVGGGDSFASGLIYGLLGGKDAQWALECGVAHGALAMSTPGDATMATLPEVLRAMKGPSARIDR